MPKINVLNYEVVKMQNRINEDLADEIMFLKEENVPSYMISETLGLNVGQIDDFRKHHRGELGLGRIYSAKT